MQGAHRKLHVLFFDDHRDLDFRGGDHLDVDAFFRQGAEHFAGHAGVRTHAHAHDGNLAHFRIAENFLGADVGLHAGLENVERARVIAPAHGEGEVGETGHALVLQNHVDFDIGLAHGTENLIGDAGPVGHANHDDLGFVAGKGDARHHGLFHVFVFLKGDECAAARLLLQRQVPRGQAGEHAQANLVLAREFHRADLQHLGAEAGHLQHFFEGDGVEPPGFGHDARIGGVDAVDVGVDLAFVGLQGRCERHARGI